MFPLFTNFPANIQTLCVEPVFNDQSSKIIQKKLTEERYFGGRSTDPNKIDCSLVRCSSSETERDKSIISEEDKESGVMQSLIVCCLATAFCCHPSDWVSECEAAEDALEKLNDMIILPKRMTTNIYFVPIAMPVFVCILSCLAFSPCSNLKKIQNALKEQTKFVSTV